MGNYAADDSDQEAGLNSCEASADDASNILQKFPLSFSFLKDFVAQSLPLSTTDSSANNSHALENQFHQVAFFLESALRSWCVEATLAASIFERSALARLNTDYYHGQSRGLNLALVCLEVPSTGGRQARFVHWQSAGQTGRPVDLDKQNRVKALVCVGDLRAAMDLSKSFVIHPDVGVAMQRARGYRMQERPQMNQDFLRLQNMCDKALSLADDFNIPASQTECALCRGHLPGILGTGDVGDVFQCPCCLQPLDQDSSYMFSTIAHNDQMPNQLRYIMLHLFLCRFHFSPLSHSDIFRPFT